MADLTANSSVKVKRGRHNATQADTIGQVFTRTATFVFPNPSNIADTIAIMPVPPNTVIMGVSYKTEANLTANVGIELNVTANANGAGGVLLMANAANNFNITQAFSAAANYAHLSTGQQYIAVVPRVANNAVSTMATVTALMVSLGDETATYATYTL